MGMHCEPKTLDKINLVKAMYHNNGIQCYEDSSTVCDVDIVWVGFVH